MIPDKNMRNLTVNTKQGNLTVESIDDNIIRIQILHYKLSKSQKIPYNVIKNMKKKPKCEIERNENNINLITSELNISYNIDHNKITFHNKEGKLLLYEDDRLFKENEINGEKVYQITQQWHLQPNEAIYGLGQHQDGYFNYNGKQLFLFQQNTVVYVPFLLSSNGYGILWNNASYGYFDASCNDVMKLESQAGDSIEYYFIYGPAYDEIIKGYRDLTGHAPLLPKWSFGYIQSKERYVNREDVLSTVSEFRKRNIPIDCVVQDWSYWGSVEKWSSMEFDAKLFPLPEEMLKILHDKFHVKLMIAIWPVMGIENKLYKELNERNLLYPLVHWSGGKFYDAFNEKARDIYWKHAKKGLFEKGVDAWWMDCSEPIMIGASQKHTPERMSLSGKTPVGDWLKILSAYSYETTKGFYENQRKATSEKRVFIFTRSAWTGQQQYSTVIWSGDIQGTWDVFRKQVSAGINMCMSGIPYWTCDVGGFFVDYPNGCENSAYRELYVRWFQFGTFCPVLRSHGTGTPREPWRFGEKGEIFYDTIIKFIKLRYRLLPYIYSLAYQVTRNGYTIMRGLPMDFNYDSIVHNIGDQYMFGPSFLICPVTESSIGLGNLGGNFICGNSFTDEKKVKGTIKGSYYYGKDFEEHVIDFNDRVIDIKLNYRNFKLENDEKSEFFLNLPENDFSIRWDGFIQTQKKGTYTFIIRSDGGVRLWIDGDQVFENWHKHTPMGKSISINLPSNSLIPIVIEYYGTNEGSEIKLLWVMPQEDININEMVQKSKDYQYEVYLPKRNTWYDFWTGKKYTGGKFIRISAPLDIMPIFVKGGSIIPLGPNIQYSTEMPAEKIELRIYPGENAEFFLYEDENDNYNYEKEEFSSIHFLWDDLGKKLTINKRKGFFSGMIEEYIFNVILIVGENSRFVDDCKNPNLVVHYNGDRTVIDF